MSIMIDHLRKVIKDLLTPQEYDAWDKAVNEESEDCLMENHLKEEAKKPAHMRNYYAHLSCPCSRCSPGRL